MSKQHTNKLPKQTHTTKNAPYPGLRPYREDEESNFFGRDADCKILIDKILVHRLTLLFAATGVGKSSLLQAAVLPQLKSPHKENLDVAYYMDWVSNPLEGLKQKIRQDLQACGSWQAEITYAPKANETLLDFLNFCSLLASQPLIIVLDQFEEFFRYQKGRQHFEPFLEQLTAVISNPSLPVHLVFSMREDFALELDAFKKYLPLSLFDNLYRLDKLGRPAAREAILSPIKNTGFRYEPELLEQLLTDLLSRDLRRDSASPLADMTESVEPPYLQIVCSRLWQREKNNPNKTLRLASYQKAGAATGLLENYIHDTLHKFSEADKVLASRSFDHLISRHGAKMPYTPEDLSSAIGKPQDELENVLKKLTKARILRSQQREDKIWYELYHDMFSGSIESWNTKQKEKMRNKRAIKIVGSALASIIAVYFGVVAYVNYSNHHFRLASGEESRVEIYRGKKNWHDPFNQQQYEYETQLLGSTLEPDKRLDQRQILEYADLNNELTDYRPLEERITGYIEEGNFSKAQGLSKKSISSNNPKLSRNIVRGLFRLKTESAFNDLKKYALNKKQNRTYILTKDLFQDNTLSLPLNDLKPFDFFKTHIKQGAIRKSHFKRKIIKDFRLLKAITYYVHDDDSSIKKNTIQTLGYIGDSSTIKILSSLLKAGNDEVQQYIIQALGGIGDPSAINILSPLLTNKNTQKNIIKAFGEIGDPHAINILSPLLETKDEVERLNIASTLGKLGDPDAIYILIQLLKSSTVSIRRKAIDTLGKISTPTPNTINELLQLLNDKDKYVQIRTAQALEKIGGFSSISSLSSLLLTNKEVSVRQYAAEALRRIGTPAAINELTQILKSSDEEGVRLNVAQSLGKISNPNAISELFELLESKDEEVRQNAVEALGNINNPKSIDKITRALDDTDQYVKRNAAEALGKIGSSKPNTINKLFHLSNNKEDPAREFAIKALGQIGTQNTITGLIKLLSDQNERIRGHAIVALGQIGSSRVIAELSHLLKDENAGVRQDTAYALGRIGDPSSIDKLTHLLNDEHEYVRQEAAYALKHIGTPSTIQFSKKKQDQQSKWKDIPAGNLKDRKVLLNLLKRHISVENNQQLLRLASQSSISTNIRKTAVNALLITRYHSLIPALQKLQTDPRIKDIVNKTIKKLAPPKAPLDIFTDKNQKLDKRLAALKYLAKSKDTALAKQEILRIAQQEKEDALSNLAYRLIGDLQLTEAIELLEQRLEKLDDSYREWRELRDSKASGLASDEEDKLLKKVRAEKAKIRLNAGFDYAYALARLDPERGFKLLDHNLAEVRHGAYTGFAMKANIQWLIKLDKAREKQRNANPIFRYSAFRAIDIGLSRLEILGNNDNNDKELNELKAWMKEIKTRKMPEGDPDDEVRERLEWTILMMEHYNKLNDEFKHKFGQIRVWPENTLPVNQPYPEKS